MLYVVYTNCEEDKSWDFLLVKWLRLHTSNAGSVGLIPGQGTKILDAVQCSQKVKKIIKRVNPKSSHYKERIFFFSLYIGDDEVKVLVIQLSYEGSPIGDDGRSLNLP